MARVKIIVYCFVLCSCVMQKEILTVKPASMAHLDVRPTGDQEVVGLTPARLASFNCGD